MPKSGRQVTQRWRKKYHGQTFYFNGNYAEALEAWKVKRDELEATPQASEDLPPLSSGVVEYIRQMNQGKTEAEIQALLDTELHRDVKYKRTLARMAQDVERNERIIAQHEEANQQGKTLEALVQRFLDGKQAEVEAGDLSVDRWGALKTGLTHFLKFAGNEQPPAYITETLLADFREWLLGRVTKKEIKRWTAHTIMAATKQFVRYLWVIRLIDLPRNLTRHSSTQIKVGNDRIETFDVDELRAMIDKAPERTQLYTLCALNCGYYQQDLADLTQAQVDLRAGTITRKRSKSEDKENAPEVTYYLWPETLRLLKKYNSQSNPFLQNEQGLPILRKWIKDGKTYKTDNVHSSWKRLQKALDWKKLKPYMLLRKTSASLLETHAEYGRYAQYFLGQAPKTVADKRYVKPSEEQFKAACKWLGQQYGF